MGTNKRSTTTRSRGASAAQSPPLASTSAGASSSTAAPAIPADVARRLARKERNRVAAQNSRDRKRAQLDELEEANRVLTAEVQQLRQRVEELEEQLSEPSGSSSAQDLVTQKLRQRVAELEQQLTRADDVESSSDGSSVKPGAVGGFAPAPPKGGNRPNRTLSVSSVAAAAGLAALVSADSERVRSRSLMA